MRLLWQRSHEKVQLELLFCGPRRRREVVDLCAVAESVAMETAWISRAVSSFSCSRRRRRRQLLVYRKPPAERPVFCCIPGVKHCPIICVALLESLTFGSPSTLVGRCQWRSCFVVVVSLRPSAVVLASPSRRFYYLHPALVFFACQILSIKLKFQINYNDFLLSGL